MKKFISLVILASIVSSCSPYAKYTYLTNKKIEIPKSKNNQSDLYTEIPVGDTIVALHQLGKYRKEVSFPLETSKKSKVFYKKSVLDLEFPEKKTTLVKKTKLSKEKYMDEMYQMTILKRAYK